MTERPEVRPGALYLAPEVAVLLGVNVQTVRRWHRNGKLRGKTIGGRKLYWLGADILRVLTADSQEPPKVELTKVEPQRKRKPLGHELVRNGGAG